MKKIIISLALLAMITLQFSCSDDEDCCDVPNVLEFVETTGSIPEDSIGHPVYIRFSTISNEDRTVEVTIPNTEVYGEDFTTTPNGASGKIAVTVPAGETYSGFLVNAIDNNVDEEDKTIKFGFGSGFELGSQKTFTLTIKDDEAAVVEDPSSFEKIGSINLATGTDGGAAEISAYDPSTKKLFVVNNENDSKIDILDFSDPSNLSAIGSIDITPYGGGVNSVAVKNGLLAAAVEADNKQENGKVVVFKTSDHTEVKVVTVGALPDMVTFSPDAKYILSANEGEPDDDYEVDPNGSISIINVASDYAVTTLSFDGFAADQATLEAEGFRIFGPGASFAQDVEPEYITISDDSKYAWVSLQENNGIAKVDIDAGAITKIFPLGFKDFSAEGNEIDPSDKDDEVSFGLYPVKGIYMPDALAYFSVGETEYIITANEGDTRDYDGYSEEERAKSIYIDQMEFEDPNIQDDDKLGRLTITTTLGDTDTDGIFEELYVPGARSFSIWDASNGDLKYDCGSAMEKAINDYGIYDDSRSDNKGVEPEGVTIGKMGDKVIAFIGLERVDAVVVYDVTNPEQPTFLQILETGDAPEGLIFIPASQSPTGASLLVVSSEDDGQVMVFEASAL
ncbi:choice-of-anchor I family protein [Fulvivirga ligni]|uniref:choice-of-anchor I family protein n=1 Tax=Fulvivirga ligni TaxID=2904246 RepID=UPI001F3DE8F9|nr:choice-of-anchor I family protein [Fulvivirga ligni]UII21905.1 choice-of-anchor I family protein [Fulvivirga ligni]